jgi:OmpA-OmpF porin, OOP family
MMKKSIAAILLGCFALSAHAEGFYAAADLGAASYSNTSVLTAYGTSFANPGAISIAGGYHFNRNIGVEAGFTALGDSKITTYSFANTSEEKLKTSVFQVAAVGTFPVDDHFELFVKLGMANTKIDYTYVDYTTYASASATQSNLMVGFGGQYNFNRKWGLRAQFVDFGKTTVGPVIANGVAQPGTIGDIGVSVFSVGGVLNF